MDFTIEGLLLGLLALAIGGAFAFWGFRVFLILLPIWGFFVGFLLGANAMAALVPDSGFLLDFRRARITWSGRNRVVGAVYIHAALGYT